MKIKFVLSVLVFFLVLFSSFTIKKSLSFFSKSIVSGADTFITGEWVSAETSLFFQQNGIEYSNEENIDSYVDLTGEHFLISIKDEKPQFLSFEYKINTQETAALFDSPILLVKLGEKVLLQINQTNYDEQWHSAYVDLTQLALEDGVYDLKFIKQNTFDTQFEPEIQLRNVTTTKLFSLPGSVIKFKPNKKVASLFISYFEWQDNQVVEIQKELTANLENGSQVYSFTIPATIQNEPISFWTIDLFDNREITKYLYFENFSNLGASEFSSQVLKETENELNIRTFYLNSNSSAKFFLAKISSNPIITFQDWQSATILNQKDHQQFNLNSVNSSFSLQNIIKQNLVFDDLPESNFYLTLKLCNTLQVCENFIDNQYVD